MFVCLSVSLFTVRELHVTNTDFFKLVHSLGTSPPDRARTLPVWVPPPDLGTQAPDPLDMYVQTCSLGEAGAWPSTESLSCFIC